MLLPAEIGTGFLEEEASEPGPPGSKDCQGLLGKSDRRRDINQGSSGEMLQGGKGNGFCILGLG